MPDRPKAEMPIPNRFDSRHLSIAQGYRVESETAFRQTRGFGEADAIAGHQPGHGQQRKLSMFTHLTLSRAVWAGFALAGVLVVSAQPVFAGECPADKIKPNARQMVDYKPVGVTDVTLGSIDLEKQPANIKDRELRFRKLTIEPGGIVPWHSHDDRPALIYVQQGEIVEYASNCIDPIMHKAGDLRPEVFGTSHWWKNLGKETVVLYVGDVRKDPHDHNV
jgi:quercetin dioxygenase-like cupin family protein